MSIISHFEENFGLIEQGWTLNNDANNLQVVCFANRPFQGAVTYATLGLSNFILLMEDGIAVRQELVLCTYRSSPSEKIASFLMTFSNFMIERQQALLKGDVVGPSDKVINGYDFNAIYSTTPYIFDDDVNLYSGTDPLTILVWVIPIYNSEAMFIKRSGWRKFEDILDDFNPDLLDFSRGLVV